MTGAKPDARRRMRRTFAARGLAYTQPDLNIGELCYRIKGQQPNFGGFGADSANITTTFYLIVPDFDAAIDALQTQDTRYPVVVSWQYSFDSTSPDEAQIAFVADVLADVCRQQGGADLCILHGGVAGVQP